VHIHFGKLEAEAKVNDDVNIVYRIDRLQKDNLGDMQNYSKKLFSTKVFFINEN